MIDIYLDPRNMVKYKLLDADTGKTCALGELLWFIGVPSREFLELARVRHVNHKELNRQIHNARPLTLAEIIDHETEIADMSDGFISLLELSSTSESGIAMRWLNRAIQDALTLIEVGKKIGVNFIICSKLNLPRHVRPSITTPKERSENVTERIYS